MFEKINRDYYNSLFRKKEIYIWGTGGTAQDLLRRIPTLKIRAFIDSYKKIDLFMIHSKEYPIILPAEIEDNVFCIIASIYYEEIKETLEQMGKVEGIDFLSYRVLLPTPAEMIKQMLDSDRVTKWECEYHKNTKRLQRDGSLGFCMNTPWLNPPNGNIFLQSYDEICNSIRNKLINISIEEGIYCFCDKNRCNPLRENIEKKEVHNRSNVNKEVNCAIAAFDRTCNLHCESCRNETIIQSNLKIEYMKKFFIQELLPTADIINCAGEGEALYSNAYMNIFEACRNKNKKIIVLSNGTFANKEMVDNLVQISNEKLVFSISIDAAKKETYESLRRGANYEVLLSNMKYIGELVKQRKIRSLGFNFVISKKIVTRFLILLIWQKK